MNVNKNDRPLNQNNEVSLSATSHSGKQQNQSDANGQESDIIPKSGTRHRRWWVVISGIIFILVMSGITVASCSKSNRTAVLPLKENEFRYAMIEKLWNQYAKKFSAKFQLSGERGGDDSNIITALNRWLSAFHAHSEPNYLKELENLKKTFGVTTYHAWEDFRREHLRKNELLLNPEMEPTAICEAINNYIGVAREQNPQDYISPDTVKTIVYMNNLCAFFEGEKDRLHKEGIDTEIHECSKLAPGKDFPLLDEILNK